ncbi:MAG: 4Fe-4S binding protein [Coriobacteriales bacterium]|jgi:ferredoxin-type protein NapH|nr:4Fe-4S binding protein [Coriobacteriales bacterium]
MKLSILRRITLALAFVLIVIGLILNIGAGTLSSFGWQAIAAICPLGGLESMIASKTIFPRALVVLVLTALFVALFGKVFCSWICPVSPLRSLLDFMGRKRRKGTVRDVAGTAPATLLITSEIESAETPVETPVEGSVERSTEKPVTAERTLLPVAAERTLASQKSCGSCSTCTTKRAKLDSRHLVLGGSLLSAAIFGFPVFCLVCPIGLTFGTVILLWQWFNFDNISLSLLIYPAILILELLVLRKWCARFCPLGALLSLMSLPNRFFRPQVNTSKCLREQGKNCSICHESCPEELDPHYREGMNECSKCGLCRDNCPAQAISIPFRVKEQQGSAD